MCILIVKVREVEDMCHTRRHRAMSVTCWSEGCDIDVVRGGLSCAIWAG